MTSLFEDTPSYHDDEWLFKVGRDPELRQLPLPDAVTGEEPELEQLSVTDAVTTLMLKNIPNNCSREQFLDLLDTHGFRGLYDFVYLPLDFNRGALKGRRCFNKGYAFVNIMSVEKAQALKTQFNSFQWSAWGDAFDSAKVCEVVDAQLQGCLKNVNRYRNSRVMHEDVPDAHKPMLFGASGRIPFPSPTRKLKHPWTSDRKGSKEGSD
jgi:hypothetical protein